MFHQLLNSVKNLVVGPHLDERRRIPRAICRIDVSCQDKDRTLLLSGVLKDLSMKGAQLKLYKKVEKGMILGILPPKILEVSRPERMVGKVAWIRSFGSHYLVGLRFAKLPKDNWVEAFLMELGLQTTAPKQRREHVRFPASLRAECSHQGENFSSAIKDLSLGGVLLETARSVEVGKKFEVILPKYSGAPRMVLSAECKNCDLAENGKYALSAEFVELDNPNRKKLLKHLKALLKQNLTG